ncbi:toxin-antitoxin system YwqK family antitoxin [Algoriphagus confluentis]
MKTLLIILLGLSLTQNAPENDSQVYFYFGNTNLIGIGPIEEGKKSGTWKIYKRVNELSAPQASLDAVRGVEVEETFDLSKPVFQVTFKDNLPDGLMEEFYANGQIKKLVNFSNGKLNGEFFEFNLTGDVLLSGSYQDGLKEGEWNSYYKNGTKKSEYSYSKNLLHGTYKAFFPDGNLQKSVEYQNDQENGSYMRFHEDGQPEIIGAFAKGELNGSWENFDNLGELISKGEFLAGIKVGIWKEQVKDVQGFYRVGEYKEGRKDGVWKVVDETGFVFQEEQFIEDRLVSFGEFKTKDGRLLDAGKLVNGTGKRLVYDREGYLLENGRYTKGVRTGVWYTYYPKSTVIASRGSYSSGEKVGTWRYFGFNGESLGEEILDSGSSTVSQLGYTIKTPSMNKVDHFRRKNPSEPTSTNDLEFLMQFTSPNPYKF